VPVGMSRLKIGRASDVWSLGCIFYQMVYGAPPFQAYNMHQKMRIIPDDSWKIQYPDVSVPIIPADKTESGQPEKDEEKSVPVPACFIATMQRCLERDPKKRATIPELLAEEWVNTIPATRESIVVICNKGHSIDSRVQKHLVEILSLKKTRPLSTSIILYSCSITLPTCITRRGSHRLSLFKMTAITKPSWIRLLM